MVLIYMVFGLMEGKKKKYCFNHSVDALPYDTLGSGSYAAMSVLEHRYKPDMNVFNRLLGIIDLGA